MSKRPPWIPLELCEAEKFGAGLEVLSDLDCVLLSCLISELLPITNAEQ
jgi:hypothetical protein